MQPIVSPRRAAEIDQYMMERLRIPGILLMEQAACALANAAQALCPEGKILVVCGKGNNGGDGWAAARILLTRGYDVHCCAVSTELSGDAATNYAFFRNSERVCLYTPSCDFFSRHADANLILDALFGTGLSREPAGIYTELIDHINHHSARVISADIPSGVFGETGECANGVYADVTVTFQYAKPGHFLFPGRAHTGRLVVEKIGIDTGISPHHLFHANEITLPQRSMNTNKGTYGRLGILAGKKGMAGAAVLCAKAAIRAGSGLTQVGCTEFVANVLQSAAPSATVCVLGEQSLQPDLLPSFAEGKTALAVGPGLGQGEEIIPMLAHLLPLRTPKVLDADALNVIAKHRELLDATQNAILTPHPKEFSRLSGMEVETILKNPMKAAVEFAVMHQVVVLLKGATTVVTDGETTVLVTTGAPSMAKGGSGDVLTGVTGSFLAQGFAPLEAAYTAAYVCGKAGERAAQHIGAYAASPEHTIEYLMI